MPGSRRACALMQHTTTLHIKHPVYARYRWLTVQHMLSVAPCGVGTVHAGAAGTCEVPHEEVGHAVHARHHQSGTAACGRAPPAHNLRPGCTTAGTAPAPACTMNHPMPAALAARVQQFECEHGQMSVRPLSSIHHIPPPPVTRQRAQPVFGDMWTPRCWHTKDERRWQQVGCRLLTPPWPPCPQAVCARASPAHAAAPGAPCCVHLPGLFRWRWAASCMQVRKCV